jgi:hypothetical protein
MSKKKKVHKTLPINIRIEPIKWKAMQKAAMDRYQTAPQLVRKLIDEFLKDLRAA